MRRVALEHLLSGQLDTKRNLQISTFDADFNQLIRIGGAQFIKDIHAQEAPPYHCHLANL